MIVKFKRQRVNINIIQVYAPTSDAPDEEIQLFYEALNKAFSTCKSPEVSIMRKVKQRSDHLKFAINGVSIQNIRYADDTVLLARSKVDLENLLHILKEESEIRGLNINRKKKKLMVFSKNKISPKRKITLDDEELQ